MGKLFAFDGPIMRLTTAIGNLILINCLFLSCSIPIITIGAALTAMQKLTQDMAADKESKLVSTFFSTFRQSFKQSTLFWLLILLMSLSTICVFLGNFSIILRLVISEISIFIFIISLYLFPLIARYQNTLKEHLINSIVLAFTHLPRTVLLLALHNLPFLLVALPMDILLKISLSFVFLGFSLISFLANLILIPVFNKLECQKISENK